MSLNKQLDALLNRLDEAGTNKKKTKKLKADIASLRRYSLNY